MERLLGRHRGTVVVGTALAIVLLFLAGLVGALTIDESGPAKSSLDPTAAVLDDPTPVMPAIDLSALITPAPAGFDRTTPDVDGSVTKDQLAQGRGNQAGALTLFDQLGLQGGFVRTWQRTGADDLLALRLYQFGRPSGATRYVELGVDARSTGTAKRFDVTGVEGAVGVDAGVADDGRHLAFVFVRKGRIVTVVAASLREPPDLATVTALARSQVALLP